MTIMANRYPGALIPDHFKSVTAGGFVYLAGSDLIPELQKEVEWSRSVKQFLSIILGVGVMALLVFLE